MSKYTDYFNLFKHDVETDGENEFDIQKALNDNWDKLDAKLKEKITDVKTNKADRTELEKINTQVQKIEDSILVETSKLITKEQYNTEQQEQNNVIVTKLNIADKATTEEVQNGTNDTKYMTPLKTKESIDKFATIITEEKINNINNFEIAGFLKSNVIDISNKDANTLKSKMFIGYGNDLINTPNAWGHIIWLPRQSFVSNTDGKQLFMAITDNTIYSRNLISGEWSNWNKIAGQTSIKSSITVYKNVTTLPLPAAETNLTFDNFSQKTGTDFSLSNGRIVFNKAMERVVVVCQVWIFSNDRSFVKLYKNSTNIGNSITKDPCFYNKHTIISPTMSVEAGDVLNLKISCNAESQLNTGSDTPMSTFLSVYEI